MKFWVKFSRTIFKLAAQSQLKKVRPKLLEPVLAKSVTMLDDDMILEMRSFVLSQQTPVGGFSDRAGKCDLYYSLFGYFIAEALSVNEVFEPLKKYISATVAAGNLTGVYRYCGAVLYAKLVGLDEVTEKLRKEIVSELLLSNVKQPEYSSFLAILALFYLEDYLNIQRVVNRFKRSLNLKGHPCPVVAATAVMTGMAGNTQSEAIEALKSFYRGHGGFAAVLRAPEEDLLSTGVALFALHFLDADIRLIKPECLFFVDDLYLDGGFRATPTDFQTDVEYTFYGLLALGSMN
ncbi:MAG: prenyltransferase/squalene oxidase repeat-containing protein [Mariniphaga sp.]